MGTEGKISLVCILRKIKENIIAKKKKRTKNNIILHKKGIRDQENIF